MNLAACVKSTRTVKFRNTDMEEAIKSQGARSLLVSKSLESVGNWILIQHTNKRDTSELQLGILTQYQLSDRRCCVNQERGEVDRFVELYLLISPASKFFRSSRWMAKASLARAHPLHATRLAVIRLRTRGTCLFTKSQPLLIRTASMRKVAAIRPTGAKRLCSAVFRLSAPPLPFSHGRFRFRVL